ncbi:fumarylacetoacetate hydrolase family protein [Aquimarina hainanensis]|uniref:Fumarylacetoacetate hydrolase family protein n=1 Tax=Aquimarina hainanensis TaxID=1578017 RepID=A0ABW5N966_9FLAO|nr:fumarylacetoacetate hydrolase family protein [Aquimarina sp. TRL1]QKX05439.1 fumarylacetoacetate hydrolase family protein [Aquimarina sp. TRL1]
MKFASYKINNRITYGSIIEKGNSIFLTDIGKDHGFDLCHWIQTDRLEKLEDIARNTGIAYTEQEIEYVPPILSGEKIACIGVNYTNRNAEYKDNSELPQYPSLFLRYLDSFTGHQQNLVRPPESHQLDYEGEIVIVIGKPGRRIPENRALEHIAGLTLMNEGTIRDWVRHAKFNVTQGKNFEKSGAIGPWFVTATEITDYTNLTIETRVNGEVRQQDTTANLMFSFAYIISYLSTFMTLKPGDMISTGTPNGAGARFSPPIYLAPGDIVTVSVPEIGILKNGVEDEKSM